MFWHVGMSGTVIHDQALDELGVGLSLVQHFHDFDHEQIDGLALLVNGQHCVHDNVSQMISKLVGELGLERALGHLHENFAVGLACHLDIFEDLQCLVFGQIEAFDDNTRVQTFGNVHVSLLEHLGYDEH